MRIAAHDSRAGPSNERAKNGLTYAEAGVDIDAGNLLVEKIKPPVRSTRRPGADGEIGGFGGLFDLKAAGFSDPVLVAANDGVGTKLKIAIDAGKHDTIGIDLVAMCVNDIVVQGAEPLFFLDYFATGKLDPDQGAAIVGGIAEGCRQAGCALIGGETAEMPGMYHGNDYDLAGFAVGAAERGQLLPTDDIVEGDVMLGLASSGAAFQRLLAGAPHRRASGLGWDDAAPFAEGPTLAEALLEPTRIYVKPVLKAIRGTHGIKALAHITGGGFPENIPRVLPKDFSAELDLDAIEVPPVFSWLANTGGVAANEMMRTFNCGIGMVAGRRLGTGRAGRCRSAGGRRDRDSDRPHRAAPRRRRHLPGHARAMTVARKRVAILISGRGTNMARLIEAAAGPGLSGRDRRRHLGHGRMRAGCYSRRHKGIRHRSPSARTTIRARKRMTRRSWRRCRARRRYRLPRRLHALLSAAFVKSWEGRMINIHPALLPPFQGLDTHRRAIEAGVRMHGCTVHFVTARWTTGRSSRRPPCRSLPATRPTPSPRAC